MPSRLSARVVLLWTAFGAISSIASTVHAAPDVTQVRLNSASPGQPVSFVRELIPALTRAGCNAGACHGSFQGRGGLQLSLLGFDPVFDYAALTNASRGRRVRTAFPDHSLVLQKPTGTMPHGGGRRMSAESEIAAIFRDWMAAGMPGPVLGTDGISLDDLKALQIRVEPAELVVPVGGDVSLKVVATFGDGTTRDVTPWALYDTREKMIADVTRTGVLTAVKSGKTALTIRYLGQVAALGVSVPFDAPSQFDFPASNEIDNLLSAEWRRLGTQPAGVADDGTFLRRLSLDLIGTLPTADETQRFMADASPQKRSQAVDALLSRPEYVDYWTLYWGDLFRAHRRYLGDKGLASFNGWIRQSVRENKPVDVMTRELLTAQGNLFTHGPVAYYFIDEKVEDLAETTAQVFLGVRLQCTRCHHHPQETWTQEDYYGLAAFFSQLETKDSGAQGARFGGPKSLRVAAKENPNRKPLMPVAPRVFGEVSQPTAAGGDPREQLAAWMTRPDNPYFARNFVNRYWAVLFGRGLVEPVDDLRGTNPASIPPLLDYLARDFTEHKYDVKHLIRQICSSRAYQLSAELTPARDRDGQLFTHRVPRRLSSEVLLDAINQVTGTTEEFTGQPIGMRAIALPDPTITSLFLNTFGRPLRNSPCLCARGSAPDLSQALHLANSPAIHAKVIEPTGRLANWIKAGRSDDDILTDLYLTALSRQPTQDERDAVKEALTGAPSREEVWQDVLWTVLNCSEFVFNH